MRVNSAVHVAKVTTSKTSTQWFYLSSCHKHPWISSGVLSKADSSRYIIVNNPLSIQKKIKILLNSSLPGSCGQSDSPSVTIEEVLTWTPDTPQEMKLTTSLVRHCLSEYHREQDRYICSYKCRFTTAATDFHACVKTMSGLQHSNKGDH